MKSLSIVSALSLLALVGSASAADLSSIGTSSVEATSDYSYTRTTDTSYYLAGQQGLVGGQVNAGHLGSFALEGGDSQVVTDFRLNYPTFEVGYANGIKLGSLSIVGDVADNVLTGNKWFFGGKNTSAPVNAVSETFELNYSVFKRVKVFADANHANGWDSSLGANDSVNGGTVGLYLNPTKRLTLKVGYDRTWTTVNYSPEAVRAWGVLASVSYKL